MLPASPERSCRKQDCYLGGKSHEQVHRERRPDDKACLPVSPDLGETIIEDVGDGEYEHSTRQRDLADGKDLGGEKV